MAENENFIETVDEEGNKVSFELVDIVTVDDVEYALLLPTEKDEEAEDGEILVMRLKKDGEEFSFEAIEDDEEFDKVAAYINKYDSLYLIIEGHCDQRGTEEYNRSLGQRRADMIRDYLVNANVDSSRIRTLSCGKDKPAVDGNNEEAWGKNRRGMLLPARKKANN